METPPPSQPSNSGPPPVIHHSTHTLPSNYVLNDTSTSNGPGTYTDLDEVADAEVASINTQMNIKEAELQLLLARQMKRAREAQEAQERKSSSVPTEGRSSSGPTSIYGNGS